jgi:hypothetical protein
LPGLKKIFPRFYEQKGFSNCTRQDIIFFGTWHTGYILGGNGIFLLFGRTYCLRVKILPQDYLTGCLTAHMIILLVNFEHFHTGFPFLEAVHKSGGILFLLPPLF